MATIALQSAKAVKTISGNPAQLVHYPEAASQSFKGGEWVYLVAGKVTRIASAAPSTVLGMAVNDASGVTDTDTLVYVANSDTIFEANYSNGSQAAAATNVNIVGTARNLDVDTAKMYVSSAVTAVRVNILGLSEKDAAGDTGGRVLFQICPNYRQMFNNGYLFGSGTVDPTSLVDAAGATYTITVTGAAVGDLVIVGPGVDLAGISMTAYVSTTDTVSVRVQNESGGTLDLASSTWNVLVIPV